MYARGYRADIGFFSGFLLFSAWQSTISGVFYMISVRFGAGVLLKTESLTMKPWRGMIGRCAKKNRKIFAKAFDKAQNCAIVYITRLIRSRWWVAGSDHWESPRRDGVRKCRGSVLLKGVREFFPGNFWKEHWQTQNRCYIKCAVLFKRSFTRLFDSGRSELEDSTEESGGLPSRYKEIRWAWPGALMCLWA